MIKALWCALGLLLVVIVWRAGQAPQQPVPQLLAALTITIVFVHAGMALGWTNAAGFAAIILAVTFGVENLGAATGIPFGNYHFVVGRDLPHVGAIPLIVGPLYFGMGYCSFVIAALLVTRREPSALGLPLACAALMTLWDVAMDPVNSTIKRPLGLA